MKVHSTLGNTEYFAVTLAQHTGDTAKQPRRENSLAKSMLCHAKGQGFKTEKPVRRLV